MDEVWTALLPLGGAVLGFLGATVPTSRQLAHDRKMGDLRLKRETFRSFTSAALQWTDAATLYGQMRTVDDPKLLMAHWDHQSAAWTMLTDAYAQLLLVASRNTVRRVTDTYHPTQQRLSELVDAEDVVDYAAVKEAASEIQVALTELLDDFREELQELPL